MSRKFAREIKFRPSLPECEIEEFVLHGLGPNESGIVFGLVPRDPSLPHTKVQCLVASNETAW